MGGNQPSVVAGVVLAGWASIGSGVVLGPEAPLITVGAGLAMYAVALVRRDAPPQVLTVLAAAGSLAAISVIFGSPIVSAVIVVEAAGLGGPMGWALALGVAGALITFGVMGLGVRSQFVPSTPFVLIALSGLVVAAAAILFQRSSDHGADQVLFSGQDALPGLTSGAGTCSVGTLLMVMVCKGLAWGVSLGSFRGGPTFPAIYLGAAGGIALSDALAADEAVHPPCASTRPYSTANVADGAWRRDTPQVTNGGAAVGVQLADSHSEDAGGGPSDVRTYVRVVVASVSPFLAAITVRAEGSGLLRG